MKAFIRRIRTFTAAALAVLLLLTGAVPALAETFSAIVTEKSVPVYGEASMTEKLGSLDRYAVVRVVGYSNSIAKISYNGRIGYAPVSGFKRVDEVAKKAVTASAAPVYEQPDTQSRHVSAPKGLKVYVLATSGDWAWVEYEGAVGYVKTGMLQQTDENWNVPSDGSTDGQSGQGSGITVRTYSAVTVDDTKVYKSADGDSKRLATLKPGLQVTVLATSDSGWAYIELNGKHGYCRLTSLKEGVAEDHAQEPTASATPTPATARKGMVSVANLSVYQQANTGSKKLGTLKRGKIVNVVSWGGEWACIELNGNYGYCSLSGLARVEEPTDPEASPSPTFAPGIANAKKGTVTASKLPVYRTASENGEKLGSLRKGQAVNVLSANETWAYIELNGNYGFASVKGIRISGAQADVPAGFKKADFTATVVVADARAYASASADSENVGLKRGEEVQVCGYNKTWACVSRNGSYAFVEIKSLSRAEYAPISGDGAELQTLLKALLAGGYYDAVPSTGYDAAAISAIKRFQKACGMEETGVADLALQRIAYSGAAPVSDLLQKGLSSGDSGDSVRRIQARLYALGYLSKTASLDGNYGATTVAAVKLFQNAGGITATGTADVDTLKALYSTAAKPLPAGSKAADATSSSGGGSTSGSTYLYSVPAGLASTTGSYSSGMSSAEKLEHAIYLAQNAMGCPYVYGATGPSKFDCSGLTTYIFSAVGVSLKRSAYNQGYDDSFDKIEGASNLKRGDIVFFNTISDSDLSDHAGIYLGDGYFIHASSGAHKVVVSNLTTGYYGRVFSWGRRILK